MLWFRPSSSLPGWVACVPQGERALLAHVERRADAPPAVHWVADEAWTTPTDTLRGLKRQRALGRHRRVLQLQRAHYRLTTLDTPADVPRAEWAAAVRWQLRDAVDFPVDSAAIDVLAMPEGASYRAQPQLIAVAAAEEAVRPQVELAHGAGLPWDAIDIPETALRNLAVLVQTEDRLQALLHCEDEYSTLIVTYQGELLATRHFELSLAALTNPDDDARQRAFDQIGLELQRTLDGIERSFGQVAMSRLVVTPMPGQQALCDHLAPLLYVPVAPYDTAGALDLSALPTLADDPVALNRSLRAIGAALRDDA